jgi:hypothetical protein
MKIYHGFFISESEYVSNLDGLVKNLAEKINLDLMCLKCDNKGTKEFKVPSAV